MRALSVSRAGPASGPAPGAGDFAGVYERYFPSTHHYIAGRLGRDVADDIAADTFVIALRKQDGFDARRGAVSAWLYGIATNLIAQHRRTEQRRYRAKELVGAFGNGGREWRLEGEPAKVSTHDFPDLELGKAIPYGVYDVAANAGWVNVGTDHDTSVFAVESIRRWWNSAGKAAYPDASRLLVTADAGGSNGYRTRAWKAELVAFALDAGLSVTVCHSRPVPPSGTSGHGLAATLER